MEYDVEVVEQLTAFVPLLSDLMGQATHQRMAIIQAVRKADQKMVFVLAHYHGDPTCPTHFCPIAEINLNPLELFEPCTNGQTLALITTEPGTIALALGQMHQREKQSPTPDGEPQSLADVLASLQNTPRDIRVQQVQALLNMLLQSSRKQLTGDIDPTSKPKRSGKR